MYALIDTTTNMIGFGITQGSKSVTSCFVKSDTTNRDLVTTFTDFIQEHRQNMQPNEKPFAGILGIGVVVGPGSFTGVRLGVVIANMVALGAGCDIYPDTTLSLMVRDEDQDGVIVVQTSRNDVFVAEYTKGIVGEMHNISLEDFFVRAQTARNLYADIFTSTLETLTTHLPELHVTLRDPSFRLTTLNNRITEHILAPQSMVLPVYAKQPNIG